MTTIQGRLTMSGERAPTITDARELVHQARRDALYGTFDTLPDCWDERGLERVEGQPPVSHLADNKFEFEIDLGNHLFPHERAGLQHLFGVLSSDVFGSRYPGWSVEWEVTRVDLGDDWSRVDAAFGRDSGIGRVRAAFQLDEYEPLLAFTFKPRLGVPLDEIVRTANEVFDAGFHVVELDTRNLKVDQTSVEQLAAFALETAISDRGHVTRFSPNISLPSPLALDKLETFAANLPPEYPMIAKVDGGLDGVTTLQEVRRWATEQGREVLLTCYPLLQYALGSRIPREFHQDALVRSGADIIYVGKKPPLPSPGRLIDDHREDVINAQSHYAAFIQRTGAMPTIAGGVHAGQLHAHYELLGPDVAYFLGGAVGLHVEGPAAGAQLCAEILREAAAARRAPDGTGVVPDLSVDFTRRIEEAYRPTPPDLNEPAAYSYIPPHEVIGQGPGQARGHFEADGR